MKGFNRENQLFSLCDHIGDYDSFITHRSRRADMEKTRRFGIEAYNVEQTEKAKILDILLSGKKTLFCAAVNLLELQELQTLLSEIERQSDMETLTLKEKSAFVAGLLQDTAATKNIDLKLRKKKR